MKAGHDVHGAISRGAAAAGVEGQEPTLQYGAGAVINGNGAGGQGMTAGGNSGQVCSFLRLGRLTTQFPAKENPEAIAHASFKESSPPLQLLQKVSVSCSVEESEHAKIGMVEIQRLSSAVETGISFEDTALSTMRRLKILNVHSYVHNA
ncbi:hypothetical protein R1flu_015287 [Riccia fluitans]|uniref:Uncharacterized protein n=1 Tax=Riccia fluitans TaxID=41844 RepID=A0ABD1YIH1_9MARC